MLERAPYPNEIDGRSDYTPLQSRIKDLMRQHYQFYPDHCDLACQMLEFTIEKRLRCQQVLDQLNKWCVCPKRRKCRRDEVHKEVQNRTAASAALASGEPINYIADPNFPLVLVDSKLTMTK